MEVAVEGVQAPHLGDVGHVGLLADVVEPGQVHAGEVGKRLRRGHRFERQAHLVDVDHLAGRELADDEAPEVDDPDQALLERDAAARLATGVREMPRCSARGIWGSF